MLKAVGRVASSRSVAAVATRPVVVVVAKASARCGCGCRAGRVCQFASATNLSLQYIQRREMALFTKAAPKQELMDLINDKDITKVVTEATESAVLNPPTSFTVPVYSWDQKEMSTIALPKHIFGARVRPDILHRYIVWHRANKRLGVAKMKNRAEKSGSNRKIYPQKGQGRARTSTIRAPHKRGGGRAIPKRQKDWSFKLNHKIRIMALKSALASKFSQNKLVIIADTNADMTGKTKDLTAKLKVWGWDSVAIATNPGANSEIARASQNHIEAKTFPYTTWNVFDILKKKTLVLTPAAVEWLQKQYPPPGTPAPAL